MTDYTICPEVLEHSISHKKYLFDILFPFVSDNSKRICIDDKKQLLAVYDEIALKDMDLHKWLGYLTFREEVSLSFVDLPVTSDNLVIDICANTFDKILVANSKSQYAKLSKEIKGAEITLLEKDLAQVHINYNQVDFSVDVLPDKINVNEDNIFSVVHGICLNFKDLVEHKGLFKLLSKFDNDRVYEKAAQLLFYGVSHSYCKSNDLKLSPEVNSGNGPVDFNLSNGYLSNINVELKIADSNKLNKGLFTQLAIYNRAEDATNSIYLIIKYNEKYNKKIDQLISLVEYRKKRGDFLPTIIVVDSTFHLSASVQ